MWNWITIVVSFQSFGVLACLLTGKYILECHISTYSSLLSGKYILVCDITSESILLRGKDILGCHISTDRQLGILASL